MESYTGYTGQELVTYNSQQNAIQIDDNTRNAGTNCYPYPYYPLYPIYEEHFHHWYPLTTYITEKSKVEQGFKIVGKMLENKIITKKLTIKEFIKLVNDIAELL